jgi:hypothetical protein
METHQELLLNVSAIILENGTPFHSKVIGLSHFLVPEHQAIEEGFLLAPANKN